MVVSWWLLGCPPTLPVVVTTGRAPGIEWVGARDTPRYPHRAQGCPPRAEWGPWLSHSEMRLVPQPRPLAIPVRMPWSLLGHLTRAPREGGLAPARPALSLLALSWLSAASPGLPLPLGLCTHPPHCPKPLLCSSVSAPLSDSHWQAHYRALQEVGLPEVPRAPTPMDPRTARVQPAKALL